MKDTTKQEARKAARKSRSIGLVVIFMLPVAIFSYMGFQLAFTFHGYAIERILVGAGLAYLSFACVQMAYFEVKT